MLNVIKNRDKERSDVTNEERERERVRERERE